MKLDCWGSLIAWDVGGEIKLAWGWRKRRRPGRGAVCVRSTSLGSRGVAKGGRRSSHRLHEQLVRVREFGVESVAPPWPGASGASGALVGAGLGGWVHGERVHAHAGVVDLKRGVGGSGGVGVGIWTWGGVCGAWCVSAGMCVCACGGCLCGGWGWGWMCADVCGFRARLALSLQYPESMT